jgi:DNA-directed RNA polymerase specialized sigma24 family protein
MGGLFPTTRWTLILEAQEGPQARRRALEELLAVYWRPLYIYLRRRGRDAAAAEDAVQGFFLRLLEADDFLLRLSPDRGHFRGYLKTGLDHFLSNQYARDQAQKRGGGVRVVPLDTAVIERELPAAPEDPALAFDREWALAVMEQSLSRLRAEYADGRRQGDVETVLRFFGLGEAPTYAAAAAASGVTVAQFKASLHRARVRFRTLLREEIAHTVGPGADVEHEMAALLKALAA